MPAALYGVSFKKTGHLVAMCSFEKRDLADSAAAQQLLEDLVGDSFTTFSWLRSPVKVPLAELAVDPIGSQVVPPEQIASVYVYRVQAGSGALGDGKEKDVQLAPGDPVASFVLHATGTPGLTVTLKNPETIARDAWVLFEGASTPIKGTSSSQQATFNVSIPSSLLAANQSYGFLFFMDDVPGTAAFVKAT